MLERICHSPSTLLSAPLVLVCSATSCKNEPSPRKDSRTVAQGSPSRPEAAPPSQPSPSQPPETPPEPLPAAPELERTLEVSAAPPMPGEPTALIGGKYILCARRHEAKTACLGELSLRLHPPTGGDRSLYDGRRTADVPVGIDGIDLTHLDGYGRRRCIIEDDKPLCWRGDTEPKELEPLGVTTDPVVQVKTLGTSSVALLTAHGEFFRTPAYICNEPERVRPKGLSKLRALLGGEYMQCAITVEHELECWGDATGDEVCSDEAIKVEGLSNIVSGATGLRTACVLRTDNRVFCVGSNRSHALGVPHDELAESYDDPVEVKGAYPAVALEGIDGEYVALKANGEVWAWGGGHLDERTDAHARAFDMPLPAVDVAVLDGMFCALLTDHSLRCEGDDLRMGLEAGAGRPPFEDKKVWVDAPTHRVVELIDDPHEWEERDEARKRQGLPPFEWK